MSPVVPPRAATPPALAPDAVDVAAQRHARGLWRYLRMHGAAPAEAEDLAQEAFVIALQKDALHGEPGIVAAFLRTTARFLFLRLRKAGRRERLLADAVDALWARDAARDDGDALIAAVRACVHALEGRARRAVELCYGFGERDAQDRAAIASELGMAETGVKTLLQRTRQRLRQCVQRRMGNE